MSARNGSTSTSSSNNIITSTGTGGNNTNASGGVVLGQIGDSILYYQNDQNQTFQL